MKKFPRSLFPFAVLCVGALLSAWPARSATGWLNPWSFRNPVTITNTSGSALTNFQVKITLGSSFDFTKAKSDGSDVRMTADDGTTQIPFWIENWNAASQTASIWVQVPSVPTTGATIYLYYGNPGAASASNGDATFLFFDDFDSSPLQQGYWTLGAPQTELVQDQGWETSAPHTLSVQKLNMGGHTYWGYYGLQGNECGGVGLAFSEDLVNWTKYTSNPLFTNARWPRVLLVGSTFYMVHTVNYCGNSEVDLSSSPDGLTWTFVEQLVPPLYHGNPRNQNPDFWLNPNDGKYYLFWYNGNDTNQFNILARSAISPTDLDSNTSEVTVLTSSAVLASPDMMFHGGTYFLSTETFVGGMWNVEVYSSSNPTSGFTLLPGNPVLANGSACMFQTAFGTTLHEYYCKLTGSTWTLEHRQANLAAARPLVPAIDPAKWTITGGRWSILSDTQQDGTTGLVAQGSTPGTQILQSTFSGTDYVLEAYGKQLQGRVWGLGFRVNSLANFYSINLYDDLNGNPNLYSYKWFSSTPTTLGNAAVGTVNPNTWYKLSVRVQGSSFDIFKDDVFQIHTSDAGFPSGGVALYGESGTLANFNNVLVRQFASTDPTSAVGAAEAMPIPKKVHRDSDDDREEDRDEDHDDDHKHKEHHHGRDEEHHHDRHDDRDDGGKKDSSHHSDHQEKHHSD
jgi:Domain of unknown function (DUF2341)